MISLDRRRALLGIVGTPVATILRAFAKDFAWPTRGGADGRVIEVTSLADTGPGTLREALGASGPRRIVFKVGGEIWIGDTLLVPEDCPFVTIEGATAPSPGISVLGDRIRIRAHDVIFRHIRVRVGALAGSNPGNRDGFTIDGSMDGLRPNYGVLIQNCSVSWSVDELLQVWGPNTHDIAIRNCIFSEALDKSIHPKGAHSMGPIIGPATRNIVFERNLLAHNRARNPVLGGGSEAIVCNNLIYDPGYAGVHFYPGPNNSAPTRAAIIGNVVIRGPSTKSVLVALDHGLAPESQIFYLDNIANGLEAFDADERIVKGIATGSSPFVPNSPVSLASALPAMPATEVFKYVLANAGARPASRDTTDTRIVHEVRSGTGSVRDWPVDARLDPNSPEARH